MRRIILIGPVMFTLAGIGCGICRAMLFRHDPERGARVFLKTACRAPSREPFTELPWGMS